MRSHYPIDVILWGDSLPTFSWQHGETIGNVKVALGFFGSSVFEFADCPRGAAAGFNTNPLNGLPLGWYVADQHPIEGRQGYTPDGVLWDVLGERADPDELGFVRHEFCMAGTTVYESQDSFGVWADGIADPGDDNWSGMWTSVDQHGCVFHELMANPPTGRITTLGSIGHNDLVIQGHTGRGLTFDPPATSVAATIADDLAEGLVAIGRAFDRLTEGTVAEHVLISSPRWPFDDLERQSPLAIGPTPPFGYHATGVPDDEYLPPYLGPHQLAEIQFPPPNESYPGFAQEIWMGLHFQDQWVAEDSVHRRGWYDHWWADNNWSSFVSFFNPTPGGAWAAAHAYSNSFLSQFHSLGYRAAFGTANLKSDTVAPLAEQAIDGGHQAAEAQLQSEGIAWRYIPGWDSMPVWAGTGPIYPHGHKSLWFDGIHMKEAAAIYWVLFLLDAWFDQSIHRRLTVQLAGRRPDPVVVAARRDSVDLAGLRPDVAIARMRQATRFFRLIGDYVPEFRDLTDVDWASFATGETPVYDGTNLVGRRLPEESAIWGLACHTGRTFCVEDPVVSTTDTDRRAVHPILGDGTAHHFVADGTEYAVIPCGKFPVGVTPIGLATIEPGQDPIDYTTTIVLGDVAPWPTSGAVIASYVSGAQIADYNPATGRLTIIVHCEGTVDGTDALWFGAATGLLPALLAGGDWTYLGNLVTPSDVDTDQQFGPTFLDPTDGDLLYMYGGFNGSQVLHRMSKTEVRTWAAGGAAAGLDVWNGTAFVAYGAGTPAVVLPWLQAQEGAAITDVAVEQRSGLVLALMSYQHDDGTWHLGTAWIDPATPHEIGPFTDGKMGDEGAPFLNSAGYAWLRAPDHTLPESDHFEVYAVHGLDPDPGQPWDDTVFVRSLLRSAVAPPRATRYRVEAVGRVADPVGLSMVKEPMFETIALSDQDEVVVFDETANLWRRMIVKSSGPWVEHPDGFEPGDRVWSVTLIPGQGAEVHDFSVNTTNFWNGGAGVTMTNIGWASFLADLKASEFVYDPDATPGGKVYNDYDFLMTVIQLNAGRKTISYLRNCEILPPPGGVTWDWTNVKHRGDGATSGQQVRVRFGTRLGPNASDQIVVSSFQGGSIDETVEFINACPGPIVTGEKSVKLLGGSVPRGIVAPFFDMTETQDLVAVGGVVARNAGYPAGQENPHGGVPPSWSAGVLTITFGGNGHGFYEAAQYIGTDLTIEDWDPVEYNGAWEILSFPDDDTITVAMPDDPGALVAGTNTWLSGVPAIRFSDGGFHLWAWSGERPGIERRAIDVQAGQVVVQVLNSPSAAREFMNDADQVVDTGGGGAIIGPIYDPFGLDLAFVLASNVRNDPTGLAIVTADFLDGQIAELDAAVAEPAYTPAVPGNWTTPPSTVAQALDAIAATLGPI